MVERGERFFDRLGPGPCSWDASSARRARWSPTHRRHFAMPAILFQLGQCGIRLVWAFALLAPGAGLLAYFR